MADFISQVTTPDNNTYDVKDRYKSGIYTVIGTQTSTTSAWTGTLSGVDALYDGLTILYYLPYYPNGRVTLNLTLGDGTTTGAINCYFCGKSGTTRLSYEYNQGSNIVMTYWSAGSISTAGTPIPDNRWVTAADTTSTEIGEYGGSTVIGGGNVYSNTLMLQTQYEPATFASIVTSSTISTSKSVNTHAFLPNNIIFCAGADTSGTSGDVLSYDDVWVCRPNFDLRYSFNITNTTYATTDNGKSVYLKCTLSNGLLYLDTTEWWSIELPSTSDGYYYVYVGQLANRYQCTLVPNHPIYYHDGTGIKEYIPGGGGGGSSDDHNLAAAYDATSTYDIGDYCIYSGDLYFCTTKITTAEAWDSTHWTQVTVTSTFRRVVELTQAQYDALSTDQQNDNTIYCITDAGGGGGGGGSSLGFYLDENGGLCEVNKR